MITAKLLILFLSVIYLTQLIRINSRKIVTYSSFWQAKRDQNRVIIDNKFQFL